MRIKIFFAQVLFIALFSSQSNAQTTDLVKYLPESATMIMDIDGASLSQKLSWKELMAMQMFDSLLKKAAPGTRKMIAEPSETGINFKEHLFLIVDYTEGDEENTGSHVAIYGKVLDETKLSTLLDKAAIKEIVKKTSGENKMFIGKDFLFGWNKSVFVLHSGTALMKQGMPVKISHTKKELARLEKKCIELLTPKTKNIYTTNKIFENLVNQKADMRIWSETAKMNGLGKGKNPFTMFGMNSEHQGKYKTAIVNFESGKIVSKGYTYYSEDLSASIQKMYPEKLNTELIKKIPAGNLLGLFAMSFKPDAIKEFIEKTGIWQEFKKMDDEAGDFSPGAILDNLKGDILIAVNMPEEQEEINEEEAEKNPFGGMQIYFAANVKDEKKMNQFIDSIKLKMEEKKKARANDEGLSDTTIIEKVPDVIFPDSLATVLDSLRILQDSLIMMDEEVHITKESHWFKNMKPAYRVENGVFVLSFSDAHLAKFGMVTTTVHDKLVNEYGNYPMLVTLDLKTILSIAMTAVKKDVARAQGEPNAEEMDEEMFSFFEVFDKWIITGGKFENGAMLSTQEIKFSNPDENSLKQIMKMFDLVFSSIMKTQANKVEIKQN